MPDLEKSKLQMIKDIKDYFGTTKLGPYHQYQFVFNLWIKTYREHEGFASFVDSTTKGIQKKRQLLEL